MKPFRAIADCFRKYASITGTTSRSEFWFWVLFVSIILSISTILDGAIIAPMRGYLAFDGEAGKPLSIALLCVFAVPTFTAAIRRYHDSEKSAWWFLASLCFAILGIMLVNWFVAKAPQDTINMISQYASPEVLYLIGFVPLLYFLGKRGLKHGNKFNTP